MTMSRRFAGQIHQHASAFAMETPPTSTDCAVNRMKADLIEDIKIACENSDVFPDDLPGMPPECVLAFLMPN